jgi:hypothetical protein
MWTPILKKQSTWQPILAVKQPVSDVQKAVANAVALPSGGQTQTSTPAMITSSPYKQGASAIGGAVYNKMLSIGNDILSNKLGNDIVNYKLPQIFTKDASGKIVGNKSELDKAVKQAMDITVGLMGNESGNVLEQLVKEKTPGGVSKILKGFVGLSDETIAKIAPRIAETTDAKIIDNILKNELSKAETIIGKVLPQGTPQISELLSQQKLGSSLPGMVAPEESAVNKIITALKEAKPIRGKQEDIYSVIRSQQAAKISAVGQKVSGESGYFAQLGQLKGKMPKVQFEAIRKQLTQPVIDELFNTIEKSPILSPFEKITTKTGLSKLLGVAGGTIPTKGELSLLNQVFPPGFVKAVLEKRPLMQKVWGVVGNLLNLPRAIMATADLSAPLRQGLFLVGKPKQWIPAFRDMFKYAFSEKAYIGLMEEIKARPTYKLMRENKLALTDMGENLTTREEAFMSNLSEKIPLFGRLAKGSNRAYSGFLNKLRADVFDDLVRKAGSLDLIKNNSKIIPDITKFINSATGRGDLGALNKASVVLNGAFFSPRLMASRINLLNPVYYAKLDPFVRKEALKSLLTFSATAGSILSLAKLGGASVGIDPRNADFGKIKVGDTRYDVLGGFQQYIVLAARLLTGQMVSSTTGKAFTLGEGYKPTTRLDIIQRFFESKTSPVFSFALGLAKGQTSMGEDFNLGTEVMDRFIPMLASDMFDLYRENGLSGLGMGIPGAFGVGSQTYTDLIPLESKTATGKPTIKYRQAPSLGESILNKFTGTKVEPIPVKAVYDEVQLLMKEGKTQEAQNKVNALSENDYALYKKLKAKDTAIKNDETIMRIIPVYNEVKKLNAQGKTAEAQKIVNEMTDEEYKAYQSIKAKDWKNLTP